MTYYELTSMYGHDTFMLDVNDVGMAIKVKTEYICNNVGMAIKVQRLNIYVIM